MSSINFLPISSPLISTDSGSPVRFNVTNNSNKPITVYWVDRSGNLVSYGDLNQGQSRVIDTISSHVWEIKSDDGTIALKFAASLPGIISINADLTPSFTDFSEKVLQTADGLWSTSQGYGLIDAAKSLGIDVKGDLPLNGQNNNAALNAMHAPAAWAAGYTGKGVKVALIDAGIAANAEISGKIVDGYDFYQNDKDPTPDEGNYKDHALGVAAIIAASHEAHGGRDTMGVAPDASLINVRVGSSQFGSTGNAMASGIRFAVDHGAKVICMPLQSNGGQIDQQVADAVHYAYTHNVVTVIIGGNFGNYGPTGPALIAQQLKGEAIDVGNFNILAGTPFDSSNMPGSSPFPWVMASSSGYVPNSTGGYTYWNDGGTSFAGPYVAGLAALLWQQNPDATAAQIIGKITAGAHLGESQALADFKSSQVGGPGVDMAKFAGQRANYSIAGNADGSFDIANLVDGSTRHLVNVERVQFANTTVALDVGKGELGGEAYRLYQAAFGRTPDAGGLSFWLNALDHGATLLSVAKDFVTSTEFKSLYGANPGSTELVTAMYHNVLHREPDVNGLNYWLDAMNRGLSAQQLLTDFSESAENITQVASIIGRGFEYTPYA